MNAIAILVWPIGIPSLCASRLVLSQTGPASTQERASWLVRLTLTLCLLTAFSLGINAHAAFAACGDTVIDTGEQCDDGNTADGDCCSGSCHLEPAGDPCDLDADLCTTDQCDGTGTCTFVANVTCADDGNLCNGPETCDSWTGACFSGGPLLCDDGDFCNGAETCDTTLGCQPSTPPPVVCGDGHICGPEACDDGNTTRNDGCDGTCVTEAGWMCPGPGSPCAPICGDGLVRGSELCDDGNAENCDGCNRLCQTEPAAASWCFTSPEGGRALALAIDPVTPTTLYAGMLAAGSSRQPNISLFKSTDGGGTWTGLNTGGTNSGIHALAVDPTTPKRLYAAGPLILIKSTDGAESWTQLGERIGSSFGLYALAIDPLTPTTVYAAGSMRAVFKSTDGGESWTAGPSINATCYALAIDPITLGTVYAGADGEGVYKSIDGGGTWSQLAGTVNARIRALAIDRMSPNTVYAGTLDAGVLKSTDAGGTWTATNDGLADTDVLALAIDPQAPSTVYAGTFWAGAFRSTDGGRRWTAANTGLGNVAVRALAIDPLTTTKIYAGTDVGLFRSTDGGGTWTAANTGVTVSSPFSFLAMDDSTAPATLYAGAPDVDLFKSTNRGRSWIAQSIRPSSLDPYPVSLVRSLAVDDSTSPSTLYAGKYPDWVLKSTDGGLSWSAANAGLSCPDQGVFNGTAGGVTIDPINPATVYGAFMDCSPSGWFKSTDGGENWSVWTTGLPFSKVLLIDPVTPTTMYAGSYKTTDGGATWSQMIATFGLPPEVLAIDPANTSTLYAQGGIKSTDGGASWRAFPGNGLPAARVLVLAFDPANPSILYAGTEGDGVYQSINGGERWRALSAGLGDSVVRALLIDAGTRTAGETNTATRTTALEPGAEATLYAMADEGLFTLRLLCGNGNVDEGEECDDGNWESCDGCSQTCETEVGFVCGDGVVNATCGEQCDNGAGNGVNSCCSATCQVVDSDGDGLCDADDPCDGVIANRKISIGRLDTPPGDDKLTFKGEILPAPVNPSLDPRTNGVRLVLNDSAGSVLNVTIPGGTFVDPPGAGWKVSRSNRRWTYVDQTSTPPAGIFKIVLEDKPETPARTKLVKFVAKGTAGAYAVSPGNLPLTGLVILDPNTGAQCAEASFLGPPPAPSCAFNRSASTLNCR